MGLPHGVVAASGGPKLWWRMKPVLDAAGRENDEARVQPVTTRPPVSVRVHATAHGGGDAAAAAANPSLLL